MTRCIQFPFVVLLVVWRNQSILGSDVDLVVRDATCVGNNVTLKCTINPFTTVPSATWSRNGSNALTTCTSGGPCTQDDLTIDGVKYSFTGGSSGIQVAFQITMVENDIEWICSHNATPYRYTFNVLSTCNSLCDGDSEAITVLICCSYLPAIVKLLIILWLWCNQPRPVPPPKDPREVITIRIIVTAQQKFTSAIQSIKGQLKIIPPSEKSGGYLYSIDVRAGELLDCVFQTGENELALLFEINDDVLYVKRGQHITLPTKLDVHPPYSRITWNLNGRELEVRGQYFDTTVRQETYGVYGIKMTFETLEIIICIQNMKVQERKPLLPPKERKPLLPPKGTCIYWILMVVCVVIDIACGVIGGSVTGHYRSTDGYCVDVAFIIWMVLVPMIFFNVVEAALIYFKLIKRTESTESSWIPDSTIPMMSTSAASTVSPNAGTTRSTPGQNSRNWQPPNINTA